MEELKEDLRIRRTHNLLTKALFKLLKEKPFDKISVMDICDEAMVNRATFYNHFESKSHLLNFALENIREELFEPAMANNKNSSPKEICRAIAYSTADFIEKNGDDIRLMVSNNKTEEILGYLLNSFNINMDYFFSQISNINDDKLLVKLLSRFFTGGLINLLLYGISLPKDKISKDIIIEHVNKVLDSIDFSAL